MTTYSASTLPVSALSIRVNQLASISLIRDTIFISVNWFCKKSKFLDLNRVNTIKARLLAKYIGTVLTDDFDCVYVCMYTYANDSVVFVYISTEKISLFHCKFHDAHYFWLLKKWVSLNNSHCFSISDFIVSTTFRMTIGQFNKNLNDDHWLAKY